MESPSSNGSNGRLGMCSDCDRLFPPFFSVFKYLFSSVLQADVESQVFQQLEAMLGAMQKQGKTDQDEDKDVNRVNELIKVLE